MYSLRLLGGAVLEDGDAMLSGRVVQRHPLALLALLAAAPSRTMSRDKLTALLWPETGRRKARARLNTVVHTVRKSLGDAVLVSAGDDLRLDPAALFVDLIAFEEALGEGDLERAAELYAGPLLDGFHLPDASEFDHWLDGERERLRREHARAVEQLAETAEAAEDPTRAVDWWRKRAAVDPHDGRIARRLMLALEESGGPAGALRHGRVHLQMVEELGVPPDPEVVQLMERLRSEPAVPPDPDAESASPESGTGGDPVTPEDQDPPPVEPNDTPASSERAPERRFSWGMGALVLVLVVLGATLFTLREPTDLVDDRIVVLPLENRTGDSVFDPVGRLAADWLTQGINRAGIGEVMPLADLLQTFSADEDPATLSAAEAARATGARIIVTGSVYRVADRLQLHARVLDAEGETLVGAVEPITTDPADPRPGIEQLREQAIGILASVFDPREVFSGGSIAAPVQQPPTVEAYQAFADGMDRFLEMDFAAAAPRFLRASELDSTFQRATLRAVEAYFNLREWTRVDSLVGVLRDRRAELSRRDRLLLDAFIAHRSHDREVAQDRFGQLAELYPNSYFVYAAAWQGNAYNRPHRTIRLLEGMDPNRGPMRRWAPYWRNYARAHHLLGDYRGELEIARRALREFGKPEEIWAIQVPPLAAMGRFPELREVVEHAPSGAARGGLRRFAASELRAHGYEDSARVYLDNALEWFAARGAAEDVRLQEPYAYALYHAGRYEEAREFYQELLADAPEPGDGASRERVLELRGRLGVIAARLGQTEEAARADAWLASLEWPYLFGEPALWRARIAVAQDQPDQAIALLRDGLRSANFGGWVHRDPDFVELAGRPAFREVLRPRGIGPGPGAR